MSDFGFSFDVGNNVTNMLRDVAHQLGIAVEKIYPYFVFQQVVNGVVATVAFLISSLLILGGSIFFFKLYSKESRGDYNEDNDTRELKMWAFGFFSVLLFFVFLFTVATFPYSHYIGMILNPQYYAIKDMLLTSHQLIHR